MECQVSCGTGESGIRCGPVWPSHAGACSYARMSVQLWGGVLMRRLALLFAAMTVAVLAAVPALAVGGAAGSSHSSAGKEDPAAADAPAWFTCQRLAPNGAVDPNAYAAAAAQAASLPSVGGAWTERTNLAGAAGTDFSDPPQYIDPTSGFSNSGAGDRWVSGRMTALAAAPDGSLFAGAADGGGLESCDRR